MDNISAQGISAKRSPPQLMKQQRLLQAQAV
jgi:hypothetical protein